LSTVLIRDCASRSWTMIRNVILCAALTGILVLNLRMASAEDANAKMAAYQAMFDQTATRDLNDIGNLQLTLTGNNFVFNNPSPSSPVQAVYKFPGDVGTTALPEGQSIPLPANVNMFIVEFKWQAGRGPLVCRPASKDGAGDLCEAEQQKTSARKQASDDDNLCCIVAVFARELLDGKIISSPLSSSQRFRCWFQRPFWLRRKIPRTLPTLSME
jgi:hypothetical protein